MVAAAAPLALAQDKPQRALRIAHITDIHVQPERGAPEGMEACLQHIQQQKDRPDVIFTGGDLIMDAFGQTKDRAKTQWDIFNRVLKANNSLPIEHTIGNHDVWGWKSPDQYQSDPLYGKKWACDVLGLSKPYRTFDRAGWRFIVLDSTFPRGNGYTARLDDEQFGWLSDTLANTPASMPVFVISHIPIISSTPFFDGDNEKSGDWQVPGAWMHIDARRIKDLFRKHAQVKACVSGHIHLIDEVLYNGVYYYCNGAVSAGWWGGDYQECTFGYGLVDLFTDGTTQNEYVTFPWKVKA